MPFGRSCTACITLDFSLENSVLNIFSLSFGLKQLKTSAFTRSQLLWMENNRLVNSAKVDDDIRSLQSML